MIFFFKECGQSSSEVTFANEFYLPVIPSGTTFSDYEPSCSSGRLSKTIHKLHSISEPEKYEYFQNGYGGISSTNYCPISQYEEYDSEYIYTGHCHSVKTSKNPYIEDNIGESFSPTSFCVLSSLVKENTIVSEMRAVCYQMICSPLSLTILVKNNYIVCPREGGKVEALGFEGFLLCPDYNLICTGKEICNNLLDCLKNGIEEKEESLNYDYKIKTTQNSSVYNRDYIDYGYELSDEGTCPQYCMQCDEEKTCVQCGPHYLLIDNKCIYSVPHCDSFENIKNNICIHCESGYFLAEDLNNNRFCENIELQEQYYESDTELNLYKKCEYQKQNCIECHLETELKCDECKNPYEIIDDGIICGDLTTKKFYRESDGIFKS